MGLNAYKGQDVYKDAGENVVFVTLNFRRENHKKEREAFQELCDRFEAIARSMRIRQHSADLKLTLGISSWGWDYLYPEVKKPQGLFVMPEIEGPKYTSPSTEADLFFHLRADKAAVVYDVLAQIMDFIGKSTITLDETSGFRDFQGRAVIGFIDGTENPARGDDVKAALIGKEDKKYKNGSYAFIQKFTHQMEDWKELTTEQQEAAIGRKKFSDLELPDSEKISNAHNVVSKDGEKKIIRMNVPYAAPAENLFGTYFIGYTRYPEIIKNMLTNMYMGNDRLLDFSTPHTGTLFFIPSLETLDQMHNGELE